MDFNLITNLESCQAFINSESAFVGVVNYSHISTAIIALALGIFVYVSNRKALLNEILFLISLTFTAWAVFDLITWISVDSRLTMLSWSLLGILNVIFFAANLYFVYVFIDKKDITYAIKLIIMMLFLPVFFLSPTFYNIEAFDVVNCEAKEGIYFTNYIYFLDILFTIWISILAIKRYKSSNNGFKKQIIFLTFGVLFSLIFFSWSNIIGSMTLNWKLIPYGLYGMPVFIGVLAYLIVKYQTFNIKLISAQALVAALIILVGSQFFFIQNNTNRILTGITLFLATIFGWWLVRSVKDEIKKKEELMDMTYKLSQAYTKMKQLDRAKSEFVSIASHQLRTPLTAIKGFISLLLDGTYGKISISTRTVLEKVYLSNERLIALVEDLLNISRIESGRLVFNFQSNSIENLVADIVDTMKFAAKNKGLYLDYKPPQFAIEPFTFDRDKLREVLNNLIDNAIKYTKKGGVTVRIKVVGENEPAFGSEDGSLTQVASPNRAGARKANMASEDLPVRNPKYVQVVVSDTGIGIVKGEEHYIFDKFQRGKDINKVHTEGIGLGLFVANKIIEAHEAKIWAESDGPGLGSRFYVQLKKDFVPKTNSVQNLTGTMPETNHAVLPAAAEKETTQA